MKETGPGEIKYDTFWLKSNKEEFMGYDTEQKRMILGELMFKKVSQQEEIEDSKVSKITGMLIDLEILEIEEIILMLTNPENLTVRVKEALEVIQESELEQADQ